MLINLILGILIICVFGSTLGAACLVVACFLFARGALQRICRLQRISSRCNAIRKLDALHVFGNLHVFESCRRLETK